MIRFQEVEKISPDPSLRKRGKVPLLKGGLRGISIAIDNVA
jgi:hypothetical protein